MSSKIEKHNSQLNDLLSAINNLPETTSSIENVTSFTQMNFATAEKGKIYVYDVAGSGVVNTLIYNEDRWDVYTEDGVFKGSVDLTQDTIQLDGTKLRSTTFYDVIDTSYTTNQTFKFYSNPQIGLCTLYNSLFISDGALVYEGGNIAYDNGIWNNAFKTFGLNLFQGITTDSGTTVTINMPTEFYLWLLCNSSMIVKYTSFTELYHKIVSYGSSTSNGITFYYEFDNRLRQLICDGTCWNVYDENDLLLGSIPVGKNNTVLDGDILDSYIFDKVPDLSYTGSINIPMVAVGGPAVVIGQGVNVGSSGIYLGTSATGTPIYSSTTGWHSMWGSRSVSFYTDLMMTTPSYSNIPAASLLWMLVNGRFTRKSTLPTMHPVSVYTGTFTVSDTSDITINIATSPKFVPTSFVATIVDAGSTNSVCSVVAINTTTATYTRTTSGTVTSNAGTNTVTYSVNKIVIPNRTSDNASRNLKVGTWRIVVW